MIVKVFRNIDQYTLMSVCDVIYHACTSFKQDASELAANVLPCLVKCFNVTSEEQNNSVFSLIGKTPSYDLMKSLIECISAVLVILKS